jgi:hypothetical protein
LVAACLLACTPSPPATPAPSPSSSPSATPTAAAIPIRAPVEDILAEAEVGLPRTAGRDHLSLTQAASEQENEPLALTNYRAWGWVDAADRSWAGPGMRVDEKLLLLTRPEGAGLAFQGLAGELASRAVCPTATGVDQCTEDGGVLMGRVGRYVFRIAAAKADLDRLAGLQAARIRR